LNTPTKTKNQKADKKVNKKAKSDKKDKLDKKVPDPRDIRRAFIYISMFIVIVIILLSPRTVFIMLFIAMLAVIIYFLL